MPSRKNLCFRISLLALALHACGNAFAETPIDFADYTPDCAVKVEGWNGNLRLAWPTTNQPAANNETAVLTLDMTGQRPLIEQLGIRTEGRDTETILSNVDPVWWLTVGERRANDEKSPEQKWEVFFDNPHKRPHETFTSKFAPKEARVIGSGQRCTVVIDDLTIGPFTGSIEITCYAGSRLIRLDAAIKTDKDRLAVFYDTGLVSEQPSWKEIAWIDTEGASQMRLSQSQSPNNTAKPLNVRHRAIVASNDQGSVACFPPPHQFQFPRDYTTNLGFVWSGTGYQGLAGKTGFGIRQNKDGGGNYVPWVNAPPSVTHRMGVFYLLTAGTAKDALNETLKFTHHDRFVDLPGYKTFSTHYHMALAVNAMKDQESRRNRPEAQDYVRMFKDMNVNMVHLGEFHGDGNPRDPGKLRLTEMQAMFDECRRWSDDKLLLMPGEEANVHLGLTQRGKQPGHWMLFFPKPVYWTMVRGTDQPFSEDIAPYGKVYHIGDRGDMIHLLKEENGLAWTAHPRLKGSAWTPDLFRNEDFFLADFWLGGAWKAMPADTSRDKLGERVLNLMNDMANWGHRKYVPGEVDIFTLDHTHELYGHMNINYVQLDRIPSYEEGWQPVLNVLSNGKFFVTTGEILIPKFTIGGKSSGDVLKLTDEQPELHAEIQWTFPLAFAEIISGDGQQVFRERIDLTGTAPFGTRTLKLRPQLTNRRWVRLEIWDIAANGAFTQPVWIE